MLVRMTTHITGYRDGAEWPPAGGLLEVPATEAADLIAAGYAAPDDGSGTALPPAPDPGDSAGITLLEASDGPAPQLDPAHGPDAPAADDLGPAADAGPDAPPAAGSGPADADAAVDLESLERAQLIALAAERGVEVSTRWGDKRLRAALA